MTAASGRTSNIVFVGNREANIGGLCTNCERLRTCAYVDPVNDTWFCEEYVFEQPERIIRLNGEVKVLNRATSRTGLCINCESSEGCMFPNPPGGVWFCSEYR